MIIQSDTICALSTAPGIGGIAVIRVSGPTTLDVVNAVFSRNLSEVKSHTAVHGWVMDGDERVDEVVSTLFKGPKSFTGEDTIEIACHGSVFIQQRILSLLMKNGATMAGPGEFTMRAYLNGKMDLSQAEAVGDLIASESAAAHKQALHQMRGGFSKEINSLRERLIHFASMIELELDFAEEDVEFANRDQLNALLTEIAGVVHRLRDSFSLGNVIKQGVPVAILGAPNMGKSTLLNALLNEERAIVSDIAGTTRDTIEDHITLEGIRFNFIDTAGLRETEDTIERMGIERALGKAASASIVLLLFDATSTARQELDQLIEQIKANAESSTHLILLANKVDKAEFNSQAFEQSFGDITPMLRISAKQRLYIDELKKLLMDTVNIGRVSSGETIVTNARHYEALNKAADSLSEIDNGLQMGIPSDLIAIDIRKVLFHLGEITGQINADDLLHNIFSKFCIGK